jgi:hypothetical protein
MPTVLRIGPYRVFFYANEHAEPTHVHLERDHCHAKLWLDPVRVANSAGFGSVELSRVRRLVEEHEAALLRAWNEFFGL